MINKKKVVTQTVVYTHIIIYYTYSTDTIQHTQRNCLQKFGKYLNMCVILRSFVSRVVLLKSDV